MTASALPDADAGWRARHPLPEVDPEGDKEHRGHVLIIAGSAEMPGAAALAATAALRAGAGKLTILTAAAVGVAVGLLVPEARVVAIDAADGGVGALHRLCHHGQSRPSAILVGPGMDETASALLAAAALRSADGEIAVVIDAAAMQPGPLAEAALHARRAPVVLTPHAGELACLVEWDKPRVLADPGAAALHAAQRFGADVLLKGATTVYATPDGVRWAHRSQQPGLGMSGSGDVLAGIITGLVARDATVETAAAWGVAMHCRCAERLAQRFATIGYLARDLLDEIAQAGRDLSS